MQARIVGIVCAVLSPFTTSPDVDAGTAEFRSLGGGSATAYATAVSGDGTVVTGFDSSGTVGYRWTEASGVQTFAFQPVDVSLDGSVIVGVRGAFEAVRWTAAGGVVGLGDLTPNDGHVNSAALGVSADGLVVVGSTADAPFTWTSSAGMSAAPTLDAGAFNGFQSGVSSDGSTTAGGYQIYTDTPPPFHMETRAFRAIDDVEDRLSGISLLSSASGISGDGQVVFGQVSNNAAFWCSSNVDNEAASECAGSVKTVGPLPGANFSYFDGASKTGDCIVGTSLGSPMKAMIWDDVNGLRDLAAVLTNDFGLAPEQDGWVLTQATDVSDNCTTIVGTRTKLENTSVKEAWVVTGFSKTGPPQYKCSQPKTTGDLPKASDCMFILKVAVGSEACPVECVCAPKGVLPATASDALRCLRAAVGQSVTLNCPCGI